MKTFLFKSLFFGIAVTSIFSYYSCKKDSPEKNNEETQLKTEHSLSVNPALDLAVTQYTQANLKVIGTVEQISHDKPGLDWAAFISRLRAAGNDEALTDAVFTEFGLSGYSLKADLQSASRLGSDLKIAFNSQTVVNQEGVITRMELLASVNLEPTYIQSSPCTRRCLRKAVTGLAVCALFSPLPVVEAACIAEVTISYFDCMDLC
jgi:hypothetical protein